MEIGEENLASYLLQNTSLFKSDNPIFVSPLSNEKDKYVDGYLNYLYSIQQGAQKYVVKHSKKQISSGISLAPIDPKRNYLEYMTYQLRAGLAPQMVPETFFADKNKHLFAMEDLSYLKVLRFALCKGEKYSRLGHQIGEYLARTHLGTAKSAMSPERWALLKKYFQNSDMRVIIVDFILKPPVVKDWQDPYQAAIQEILEQILNDPVIKKNWQTLVDEVTSKEECLIHGDFHSSNVFASQNTLKVIDMEYTMTGPYAYDLGYFLANILSQYASYSILADQEMCDYLLSVIKDTFRTYFRFFSDHTPERHPINFIEIFQAAIGYMAIANINRIANQGDFPDFDFLTDPKRVFLAKGLSMMLAQKILKNCHRLDSAEAVCKLIESTRQQLLWGLAAKNEIAILI